MRKMIRNTRRKTIKDCEIAAKAMNGKLLSTEYKNNKLRISYEDKDRISKEYIVDKLRESGYNETTKHT